MPAQKPAADKFIFSYDPATIRVWDSADKRKLILPQTSMQPGLGGYDFSDIPNIPYTGQEQVFVEGIAPGKSSITLSWLPDQPPPKSPSPSATPFATRLRRLH